MIPWRRKWQPTPVLLPGKFHGWRSLVGYSPWDHKESDTTERLNWTDWTVAYQAPPSMGFSRQEYWSGLPFPSPGDLPNPGIEPRSPAWYADALPSEPPGKLMQMLNKVKEDAILDENRWKPEKNDQ